MIVWGGHRYAGDHSLLNDGARYNSVAREWKPISTVGAPSPRYGEAAVWIGSALLIWGGTAGGIVPLPFRDGAAYTPPSVLACRYVLGFSWLYDALRDVVGDCLEDEQHDPTTGDAVQHTTGGLLVWRKVDNVAAFTDGYQTWAYGPNGIQSRLNTQRFSWEANPDGLPLADAALSAPVERCHTAGLRVRFLGGQGTPGHTFATLGLTNGSGAPCSLLGYVGLQLVDAQGQPLPTRAIRGDGMLAPEPGPSSVVIPSGGSAFFDLVWTDMPTGAETSCPRATYLAVTPPDEYGPLILEFQGAPCDRGTIYLNALRPHLRP